MDLKEEIRNFGKTRREEAAEAAQVAALQLICGLDLHAILRGSRPERQKALDTVERMVRRERQRGVQRHWSYDLNRHIALKQTAERLRHTLTTAGAAVTMPARTVPTSAGNTGARRHRKSAGET